MYSDIVATPKGTCVVNPIQSEYTLCGDAWDGATDEPGYEWKPAKTKSVTCPHCVLIVNLCKTLGTRTTGAD